MAFSFLRGLLFVALTTWTSADDGPVTFVSELSSKPAQKLSKYGWYGNVRLHRFQVPEETAVARWLFTVTKGHSFHCGQHNVSIHIQYGAPPVINPTGTVFPNKTLWRPCLSLILPVTSNNSTTFNLSNPAPGDWYIGAHLPEDDGRIEQKGFPSCSYFFQPQLSIRRAVDTPILQQGTFLHQTAAPDRPARLKLYVPEFASSLSVSVADCRSAEGADSGNCSLVLRLGSTSLQHRPVTVNCSGIGCSATLSNPPWDTWLRVVVESSLDNRTVTFSIVSNYTAEGNSSAITDAVALSNESASLFTPLSACVWSIPVLYEEVDVLSLRFTPATGPNVSVTDAHPTLLTYPLYTQATGGTLNLQLTLNTTNATLGNGSSVVACLSPWAPVLELNHSQPCRTVSNLVPHPAAYMQQQFYHACDQPGVAVMCIMDYDALQYCDFLGSVCSIWVTILCMARIRDVFKYTLFMLGVLLIAMSMQLDRKGLWNLLGPVLCAILCMVTAWVYRGVQRRHCYPPSWKRWVLFLIPGALCALVGVCLYIFTETEDNYYYTHSLWHILVASCVVFLLPPKEKDREVLGWSRGWSWSWSRSWSPRVCGYTLCQSDKDELYSVTGGTGH
ncbi:Transmembrane protein 8B [Liparis tanakae]|uniref:Transmembrane protein 8B n=1 Tax=Liparis tanakae TaxID=230148 RepID=A0A4Z2IV68_9TELE|nr:Transmembrane protein 8B [Liparis tanakae]